MVAISFLHTADFQVGKAFGAMGADAAVVLRRQRISSVRRIAELASERKVDAVLVAGDVFDFDTVSNETVHSWLQALAPYSGPWVVIPGNHDSAVPQSVWRRVEALGRPGNVYVSVEAEVLLLADRRLAVLTAPLQRRHESRDVTADWDAMATPHEALRVGLAHGAITARVPSGLESANPIAGDREIRSHLDYLALGDWHGTMQVSGRAWYSGTPETDRFKSNDSGNVLLVTLDAPGVDPIVEKIRVGRFRWSEIDFSISGPDDIPALDRKLCALGEPFDEIVVNLVLAGVTDLETREKVDHLLESWRGRFLYLRKDVEGLIARPSDADLDRIDSGGFVRAALERLRRAQADSSDVDHRYAGDAVAMLYRVHIGADLQ